MYLLCQKQVSQEALTNARKHAPHTQIDVLISGAPGDRLQLDVSNPLTAALRDVPGSGTGLIGLTERVTLAGGNLEHGPTLDHRFRLQARLPWPA